MSYDGIIMTVAVAGRTSVRWSCPRWCCWTPWWRTTARAWTPSCWPPCSLSYRPLSLSQERLTRHGFKNRQKAPKKLFCEILLKINSSIWKLICGYALVLIIRSQVSIFKSLRIRIRTQRAKSLSVRSGLRSWSKFAVPIKVVILYCCFFVLYCTGTRTFFWSLKKSTYVVNYRSYR